MRHIVYLTLLILPLAFAAQAQNPPASLEHTLAGYIAYALEHNPAIHAAARQVEAAEKEKDLAISLPDPTVRGGYFLSEVETRVGPQKGKIGASQMIPWPGKLLAKRKIADRALGAQKSRLNQKQVDIAAEIRKAYARLYAVGRTVAVNHENLALLQQTEQLLLSRYATEKAAQASVVKIQVEIAVLEDKIKSLEADGRKIRDNFRALLGMSSQTDIPYPKTLPEAKLPADTEELVQMALASNPSVRTSVYEAKEADAGVGLARRQIGPDIMLSTDYNITGESDMLSADDPDNGRDSWSIGASVTIPLWAGTKKDQIDKASRVAEAKEARLQDTRNTIDAKTRVAAEEYRDARRRIKLLEDVLIPKANQSLALTQEAYINGQMTVVEFLDAQRMLLELEIQKEQLLAGRERNAADLLALTGNSIEQSIPSGGEK